MTRRRHRTRIPEGEHEAAVNDVAHDGRGVARVGDKAVFIQGALTGERVMFRYTRRKRSYDEGVVTQVLEAAPERVQPRCPHYAICGGCSLQHMAPEAQVAAKQQVLRDNLAQIGKVTPQQILPPLLNDTPWGYRRKARLGVKYMRREQVVRVGFRERSSSFLADLQRCEVLHPRIGERIADMAELVGALSIKDQIPQIEVAVGDEHAALVFRHLAELSESDLERLSDFGRRHQLLIFLQPGGPQTVTRLWPAVGEWPEEPVLSYALPRFDVELEFQPTDFTQVNAGINRLMIERAFELLEPQANERILDLFCGLGNFSLPLARLAGQVVGVEGEAGLVARARENAVRNELGNVEFHATDLNGDLSLEPWYGAGFDKLLLDPPRSGAPVVVANLPKPLPGRMVYVSCDPATLARDAGVLVNEQGYRLVSAGVMDMFPHTAHVESIALFER